MANQLLVAISHEMNLFKATSLMSQASEISFREQVAPLLTSKSLVLLEGFYSSKPISASNPEYARMRVHFPEVLTSSGSSIMGIDSRLRKGDPQPVAEMMQRWFSACYDLFLEDLRNPPGSCEEIEERIRSGNLPKMVLSREPTSSELELARWSLATNRRFDREVIQAIRSLGSRYDRCVFVAGAVHILSLRANHEFPAKYLVGVTPQEIYYSYMTTYVWPSILLGAKAAD